MGFEISIQYHPKKEGGAFGFDTETKQEKKYKLGKFEEEISHSDLAVSLLKQLSRRDIFVTGVSVVEYVKKDIKVKETNNGIIIGGKKYSLDGSQSLEGAQIEEITEQNEIVKQQRPKLTPPPQKPAPKRRIIKQEFFWPDPSKEKAIRNSYKQANLTVGKRYDIVEESMNFYSVINDKGSITKFSIADFTAADPRAAIQLENEFSATSNDIDLSYGSQYADNMPVLRRK